MKTQTQSIYRVSVQDDSILEERVIGELVRVLMGRPSKIVGLAIIKNGDREGAKFFTDHYEAMDEFCSTYNLERDTVVRSSAMSSLLSFPESEDKEIQGFYDHLISNGFKIEHTGGGCTWWAKYFDDGTYIAVTQEADKEICREHMEELGVLVGLYHGDDCEGEYFSSGNISGATSLVNVLLTLGESKIFKLTVK